MRRILNFGSLNIDHVYAVEAFVQPGETVACTSYDLFAGGKGANQSAALGRAGATVVHAGCIGADGIWLRETLAGCGVDVSLVEEVPGPTGHAIIQVDRHGENAIVICAGANELVTEGGISKALSTFGNGDILLLQNEIANIPSLINQAKARNLSVVFNPAPFTEDLPDYPLNDVDTLILNESEGTSLLGVLAPADPHETPDELIHSLDRRLDIGQIILTIGAAGALYLSEGSITQIDAVPVPHVVDTTGAGDTFVGYFVAGLAADLSAEEALARAAAAAAHSVTRAGAMDSIPRSDELDFPALD